jgi:ABC-type proline/glycine betaine transport system ATPase subunit
VTILLVEQRAHQAMQIADWCYVLVDGRVELDDVPATLLARPDFGELFLGRSAHAPRPAAPSRHPPQATTGPAVTAAGAHPASHDEG